MKRYIYALAVATILSSPAMAAKIGVSMDKFDDNFLTVLRNGMGAYAKTLPDVSLQVEDAKDDISKQLSQVQNFIANKVDAIIVNPVDTSATPAITKLATEAGVPIVYVNRQPTDVEAFGPKAAFVGSDEKQSGTLESKEICRLLKGTGNILVMEGELASEAAVKRTADIHEVIATPDCSGMKIVAEQSAFFDRTKAQNLMTNWLSKGLKYDAVVANNDEMAIGAIQIAMRKRNHRLCFPVRKHRSFSQNLSIKRGAIFPFGNKILLYDNPKRINRLHRSNKMRCQIHSRTRHLQKAKKIVRTILIEKKILRSDFFHFNDMHHHSS